MGQPENNPQAPFSSSSPVKAMGEWLEWDYGGNGSLALLCSQFKPSVVHCQAHDANGQMRIFFSFWTIQPELAFVLAAVLNWLCLPDTKYNIDIWAIIKACKNL